MDTSGAKFVPIVDLTHDEDDTISHMSDIPLQLPASAKCFVSQFCIGNVLTSWRTTSCKNVQSPTDTKSDRNESLAICSIPVHILQSVPAVLGPQEAVQLNGTSTRSCEISSTCVLYSINKEKFSLPLIHTKRLRGKTLSKLWQAIVKHTITTCRCKFGNSNMKQTRAFPKTKGTVIAILSGSKSKLLKISEKFW